MTTANPTTSTTGSESCNAMTGVGNTSDTRLTSNGNDSLQSLKTRATAAISVVRPFLARAQLNTMAAGCRGEEKEYFMQLFIDLTPCSHQRQRAQGMHGNNWSKHDPP